MKERILFLSDLHDCHIHWFGTSTEARLEKMVKDVADAGHFDQLIVMGDVSLDFWAWNEGGSYLWNPSVSNTDHFMKTYMSRLPKPSCIIPGNHEQYGAETWREITGCAREYVLETKSALFIMLDSFSGNLAPKENSDGTYLPVNCDFIEEAMTACPDKPVFLLSHYFDMARESERFKAILRENDRILAMMIGHTHRSAVLDAGEDTGHKPILQCGNYSYSGEKEPKTCFWGWRELIFEDDGTIRSFYHTPHSEYRHGDGSFVQEEGNQDEWTASV
ncbi:MAG: metallophosphoesterase [Clostridia bacterium]|nr:metallophosphoesterase [Clostridia bacterium]